MVGIHDQPLTSAAAMKIAVGVHRQLHLPEGFAIVIGNGQQGIAARIPQAADDIQPPGIGGVQRQRDGACLPQILVGDMVDEADPLLPVVVKAVHAADIRAAVHHPGIAGMELKTGHIAAASNGQVAVFIRNRKNRNHIPFMSMEQRRL